MLVEYKLFEISLYNKVVRDLVETGKSHRTLDDGWADQRYVTIKAINKEKAKNDINNRYPSSKGYIQVSINEINE